MIQLCHTQYLYILMQKRPSFFAIKTNPSKHVSNNIDPICGEIYMHLIPLIQASDVLIFVLLVEYTPE